MKWSDKDIKENLEEIRLEKGIAAELEKTTQIIKRTGIFDTVDRMYGEPGAEYQDGQEMGGPDGGMGGMGGPPPSGGGGFGGGLDDLGTPGSDDNGDINGIEGSEPTADMGGGNGAEPPAMNQEPKANEGKINSKNLIFESAVKKEMNESNLKLDSIFKQYISKIDNKIERAKKPENIVERTDIYDKSLLINEDFMKMISSLNDTINDKDDEADK